MKLVVIMIAVSVITVSALEFKPSQVVLPPVDGSVYNGTVWIVK